MGPPWSLLMIPMPEILKKHWFYTHLISDHLHYWEDGGCNPSTPAIHPLGSCAVRRDIESGDKRSEIPEVVFVPKKQTGEGVNGLWRYDWINPQVYHWRKGFSADAGSGSSPNCEFHWKKSGSRTIEFFLDIETLILMNPFMFRRNIWISIRGPWRQAFWLAARSVDQKVKLKSIMPPSIQSRCVNVCVIKNLGPVLDTMDRYMWRDYDADCSAPIMASLLGEHGWVGPRTQMPYYNEGRKQSIILLGPALQETGWTSSSPSKADWLGTDRILNFHGPWGTQRIWGLWI